MLLVGFIIRIYHDARSPERQIRKGKSAHYITIRLYTRVLLYFCYCILE